MIRILFLRVVNFWIWRNPKAIAEKLNDFARSERGSMLDLLAASRLTSSQERKSLYLRHARDEARHKALFRNMATRLLLKSGGGLSPWQAVDTEELFQSLGEVEFLAFVHLGEKGACLQFEEYRRYFAVKGKKELEQLFAELLIDESAHAAYSWQELLSLVGSRKRAQQVVNKMYFWKMGRSYLRLGRTVTRRIYWITMFIFYWFFFPIAIFLRFTQPLTKGWKNKDLH
ncbi:MAG: ferritin-like domain-containing protein [Spirochaetota bacterium]